MKKAYNETWVRNISVVQTAKNWLLDGLITEEQFLNIKMTFADNFYRPGLFVRIGLFIFGCLGCGFFVGFLSLFLYETSNRAYIWISVISFCVFLFMLEYLIRHRKLYHSGIDNALLYAAITSLLTSVFLLLPNTATVSQYCLIIIPLLSISIYRYADITCVIALIATILTLLANLMMLSPMGNMLLPFVVMVIAAMIFITASKNTGCYYEQCAGVAKVTSLICFYLGGNYLVVREGNAWLHDAAYLTSVQIPFSPLFWLLTFAIPLIYIIVGLGRKNRMLLLTGLPCLAFSIFTLRFYLDFPSIAKTLVGVGMLMILVSVWLINLLKQKTYGLSDQRQKSRRSNNLDTILAAQLSGAHQPGDVAGTGDGSFSGAGAGGDY